MARFERDGLTWVLYGLAAWFAFLQAAPGLVVPHLRDELGFSYTAGGLHVAAFAAGSAMAGALSARLERSLGRTPLLWVAATMLATGTMALTWAGSAPGTIGSIVLMGAGGGLVLATVQAGLTDHHGERATVALAEENVAAAFSYLTLAGALYLATAVGVDWRVVLLASLVLPAVTWASNRSLRLPGGAAASVDAPQGLPRVFWVAVVMLMCATAAEWCVTAWGATFVQDVLVTSPGTAAGMMAGYFAGVVTGRVLGSRLARRREPAVLFTVALGVALVGFTVLWPSTTAAQAVVGLVLLGAGVGNLFPMGLSVAVACAPRQSTAASGRVVLMTSAATLVAPLTIGALADATSLKVAVCAVPVLLLMAGAALTSTRGGQRHLTGAPSAQDHT
jgi:MFS family permease